MKTIALLAGGELELRSRAGRDGTAVWCWGGKTAPSGEVLVGDFFASDWRLGLKGRKLELKNSIPT